MIPVVINFPGSSNNSIALSQSITASAGGGVILNGALAPFGNITPSATTATNSSQFAKPVLLAGIARPVTITSTTTATAVVFTVIGQDLLGNTITATIIGASGGSTTASDSTATTSGTDFHVVTAVKTSASSTAFSVGTGATGITNWIVTDLYKTPFSLTVGGEVSATTTTYSIQDTPDNVNTATAPVVFTNATINNIATTSLESNYAFPARAVRGIVTTNSATGGVSFFFTQAGGP